MKVTYTKIIIYICNYTYLTLINLSNNPIVGYT